MIDFTAERSKHVRFVRRDDVLAHLDEWLVDADDTRWVFVTGGPGMGKRAILSAWLARHEHSGAERTVRTGIHEHRQHGSIFSDWAGNAYRDDRDGGSRLLSQAKLVVMAS